MLEGGARQELAHLEWFRRMLPGVRAITFARRGAGQCAAGAEDGQRSYASCREDLQCECRCWTHGCTPLPRAVPRPYAPRMNRGRPLGYLQMKISVTPCRRMGAARVGADERRDDDEVARHQPQVKISPPLVSMA